MLDNLVSRYSVYLTPWNILQNYYIKKWKENTFSLSDWLFETMIHNEENLSILNNAISEDLKKYEKKWFEIKNKVKVLTKEDIIKLFKIKFWVKSPEISVVNSNRCDYYVSDTSEYKNWKLYTERNIIMFTKIVNEYIWRFTITFIDNDISIWSIFITSSKQRQWYFTDVVKHDFWYFLPKWTTKVDVFSILKKGLWFYKKMEKEWYFIFTEWEHNWIFYIK